MEFLSFVVLILLSLVAYSAGAVSQAGHLAGLKPQIIDLLLVVMIWAGAIYSRITFDLNKWLLLVVWIIVSFTIGSSVALARKVHMSKSLKREDSEITLNGPIKNLWQSWKNFSRRMGSFQSKVILSLFFFLLVSPFALAVKIFSDPLRITPKNDNSHWLAKKEIQSDLEHFRKQF